ncbi:MAG: hypothetical protein ACU0BS_01935 [Hasllibacter sp.]
MTADANAIPDGIGAGELPADAMEAARRIWREVGPAAHAVLWLVLARHAHTVRGEVPDPDRAREMAGRVFAALHALERGIEAMVRGMAGRLPVSIDPAARRHRLRAAEALRAVVRGLDLHEGRTPVLDPIPPGLSDAVREAETLTTRYLDAMDAELRRQHAHARAETRAGADAALGAMADVSARIGLISVNASIEASHAGASGAGFAVIAGEVRVLSARYDELVDTVRHRLRAL